MLAKYKIIRLIINKYIIINIATTMVRTQNIVSKRCRVSKLPMWRGKVGQHHGPSFPRIKNAKNNQDWLWMRQSKDIGTKTFSKKKKGSNSNFKNTIVEQYHGWGYSWMTVNQLKSKMKRAKQSKKVLSEEQTRNKFATTTILSSSSTTNHRYK